MEKERKQDLDVASRLTDVRYKVAFLEDMSTLLTEMDLTKKGTEGFTVIMREIGQDLENIEAIVHPAAEPLPLRREA